MMEPKADYLDILGLLRMLLSCPECRRQVSETAEACPKCGFTFDDLTRAELRKKASETSRLQLTITAGVLLGIWLLFTATTCTASYQGHSTGADRRAAIEANEKFSRGERLSDSDVRDLAQRTRYVSPREERAAVRSVFNCCTLVFGLPGLIIALYLFFTREQIHEA